MLTSAGSNVELKAKTNITSTPAITAHGDVNLNAGAALSNKGRVEAGSYVDFNAGADITNTGNIDAYAAVNLAAGNSLNNGLSDSADGAIKGASVSLTAAGGNLTNYASVKGVTGEVVLTAGKAGVDTNRNQLLNDGAIEAGSDITITSYGVDQTTANSGSVTEALINGASLTASGTVTMKAVNGSIYNSGKLTATNNNVKLNAKNDIDNTGVITARDSVELLAENGGINNTAALKSTNNNVKLNAKTEINNAGVITACDSVELLAENGGIDNAAALESTNNNVVLNAKLDIANSGELNATAAVTMAAGNSLSNSVNGVIRGASASLAAAGGNLTNHALIYGVTGDVVLTAGKGDVNTQYNQLLNDGAIEAGSNITITSYGVDQVITNSGSVTEALINGANASLTANGNVTLNAVNGSIDNRGIVKANGSDHNVTFTAAKNIHNEVYAGGMEVEVYAGKAISMTAGGTLYNAADMKANAGSAVLKADGNDTTTAALRTSGSIVAGDNVELLAENGGIDNAAALKSTNSNVALNAKTDIGYTGSIAAQKNIDIEAVTGNVETDGTLNAISQDITIKAGEAINLIDGSLTAGTDVVVNAGSNLTNKAYVEAQGSSVVFDAGVSINNNEAIFAGNYVSMKAGNSIQNKGQIIAVNNAVITALNGYIKNQELLKAINGTVELNAGTNIHNSNLISAGTDVNMLAKLGDIINDYHILADSGSIKIQSGYKITNTGNIKACDDVLLSAENDIVNTDFYGDGNNVVYGANVGEIEAQKGNITIKAGQDINNTKFIITGDGSIDFSAGRHLTNTGSITAQRKIVMTTQIGSLENATGATITSNMDYVDIDVAKDLVNGGDIIAKETVDLLAGSSLENTGTIKSDTYVIVAAADGLVNSGKIWVNDAGDVYIAANGDVINSGSVDSVSGDIVLKSTTGSVYNNPSANLISKNGSISMTAYDNVDNSGMLITGKGDISLHAETGSITNRKDIGSGADADILALDGSVSLTAKGDVNNQGDILALGGLVELRSTDSNIINTNILNSTDVKFTDGTVSVIEQDGILTGELGDELVKVTANGITVALNDVTMSAAKGTLTNDFDIYAGGYVDLTAASGVLSEGRKIYAVDNVKLHATDGNVINTAAIESKKGNVDIITDNGSIVNTSTGDIAALGGNISLKAQGVGNGVSASKIIVEGDEYILGSVINKGDLVATDKNATVKEAAGSINLLSELGNIYNYDDFNKSNGTEGYSSAKFGSYHLATGSILMSANNGYIYNDKHYLVANKNVTLQAKTGLDSFGDIIYAGKDITLTAVEGNLINKGTLVSVEGNIKLDAEKGTVVNLGGGDVLALNGNVTMNAGANAEADYKLYTVDTDANVSEFSVVFPEGIDKAAIVLAEHENGNTYIKYVDPNGEIHDLKTETGEPVVLTGSQVEVFHQGDVINRGDVVALGHIADSNGNEGITLYSAHGNVANYDDIAKVENSNIYSYDKTCFNTNTKYYKENTYTIGNALIADSSIGLIADKGYLYNDKDIYTAGNLTLISGRDLIINGNSNMGAIRVVYVGGNLYAESKASSIMLNDSVDLAAGDNVTLLGYENVTNKGNMEAVTGSLYSQATWGVNTNNGKLQASKALTFEGYQGIVSSGTLTSLNASVVASSRYGNVDLAHVMAATLAAVGAGAKTASSDLTINVGQIQGYDVVLANYASGAKLTVDEILSEKNVIIAADTLELGSIKNMGKGGLNIDINGSSGGTVKGDIKITVAGDTHFGTLNVQRAEVNITDGGTLAIDRLHILEKGIFDAVGYKTSVYGTKESPYKDTSFAIYYDNGTGKGGKGNRYDFRKLFNLTDDYLVGAERFSTVANEIASAREQIAKGGIKTYGNTSDTAGWVNLYIDTPTYQRSNGLLLHLRNGHYAGVQRYPLDNLAAIQNGVQAMDAYNTYFNSPVNQGSRYDLVDQNSVKVSVANSLLGYQLLTEADFDDINKISLADVKLNWPETETDYDRDLIVDAYYLDTSEDGRVSLQASDSSAKLTEEQRASLKYSEKDKGYTYSTYKAIDEGTNLKKLSAKERESVRTDVSYINDDGDKICLATVKGLVEMPSVSEVEKQEEK